MYRDVTRMRDFDWMTRAELCNSSRKSAMRMRMRSTFSQTFDVQQVGRKNDVARSDYFAPLDIYHAVGTKAKQTRKNGGL